MGAGLLLIAHGEAGFTEKDEGLGLRGARANGAGQGQCLVEVRSGLLIPGPAAV
jgi:hypothetical protein